MVMLACALRFLDIGKTNVGILFSISRETYPPPPSPVPPAAIAKEKAGYYRGFQGFGWAVLKMAVRRGRSHTYLPRVANDRSSSCVF